MVQSPCVPESLAAIIHQAIAKKPSDRYATASGFADALQSFLQSEITAARPYDYRLNRREIAIDRPRRVDNSANIFFLQSIVLLGIASQVYNPSHVLHDLSFIINTAFAGCVFAAMVFFSLGYILLSGWSIVAWIAGITALLTAGFFPASAFLAYWFGYSNRFEIFTVVYLTLTNFFVVYAMASPANRVWLSSCDEIRSRYRRPAKPVRVLMARSASTTRV